MRRSLGWAAAVLRSR